jgi:hypothetical protein
MSNASWYFQTLLTDRSQRTRYLNAVNTLNELLNMGVVPIVNENDTVSVSVSRLISSFKSGFSILFRKLNLETMIPCPPSRRR